MASLLRVQGYGLAIKRSRLWVYSEEFKVMASLLKVQGYGFTVKSSRLWAHGEELRIEG
jgi:hypothetical protein